MLRANLSHFRRYFGCCSSDYLTSDHRFVDRSLNNLSYSSLPHTTSGYFRFWHTPVISLSLSFVALPKSSVVSSWDCLQSTTAEIAVRLQSIPLRYNHPVQCSNYVRKWRLELCGHLIQSKLLWFLENAHLPISIPNSCSVYILKLDW